MEVLKTSNGEETGLMHTPSDRNSQYTPAEMLKMLDGIEKKTPTLNISEKYWECENVGDSVRGVFDGFKQLQKPDIATGEMKSLTAVKLQTQNGTMLLGQKVMVETFYSYSGNPLVEITYLGKKKVAKGHMKLFSVCPLV